MIIALCILNDYYIIIFIKENCMSALISQNISARPNLSCYVLCNNNKLLFWSRFDDNNYYNNLYTETDLLNSLRWHAVHVTCSQRRDWTSKVAHAHCRRRNQQVNFFNTYENL